MYTSQYRQIVLYKEAGLYNICEEDAITAGQQIWKLRRITTAPIILSVTCPEIENIELDNAPFAQKCWYEHGQFVERLVFFYFVVHGGDISEILMFYE